MTYERSQVRVLPSPQESTVFVLAPYLGYNLARFGSTEMLKKKIALLIHGWPQPLDKKGDIYQYFVKRGYAVVMPRYFEFIDADTTMEGLAKQIVKELKGREPAAILGHSIGSLVVPYLAKIFPKAKLIFIGGGVRVRPKGTLLRAAMAIGKTPGVFPFMAFLRVLPRKHLIFFWGKTGQLFDGSKKDLWEAERQINNFLALSGRRVINIVRLFVKNDNTPVLRKIKNRSIVFAGEADRLMPTERGVEINSLLRNAILVTNGKAHGHIFKKKSWLILDKLLN